MSTDTPPNPCPGPLEACVVGPRRWLMRSAPPSFLAAGEPASATHHLRLEGTLQAHGAFLGRHARCPSVGSGRGQGERGQQPTTQREREDGRKRCDSSTPHGPNKPPTHAPQRSAAHTNGAIHPSTHPIRDGAKLPVRQGADGRAVAGAGPRPRAEPVRRGCPALKCFTPTSPQLLHRAVCPGSIGSPHDGAMTATDDDGRRAVEAIRSGL